MWQHPQCTHHQATVMKQNHVYSVFYKDIKTFITIKPFVENVHQKNMQVHPHSK